MTQDEISPQYIIEMATTAYESCNHIPDLKVPKEFIFNFAKLVAAKERERLASIAEKNGNDILAMQLRGEAT